MNVDNCCLLAIDVLYSHLMKIDGIFDFESLQISKDFECPLFVTWKAEEDDTLRGCIGTTSPINIQEGLKKYSIISALNDKRFDPIKSEELENLSCTVSLLTDFEMCSSYDDWTIGIHGVSIDFKDMKGRQYHAIFLPEVMIEHKLNHYETMINLIKKSGYTKTNYDEIINLLTVKRFKTRKSSVSVTKYIRFRENVAK